MSDQQTLEPQAPEETACYHCGDSYAVDELEEKQDHLLCENCVDDYSTCDECDELHHDDDLAAVSGNSVCTACRDEHCVSCTSCDETTYRNDANYVNGDWMCRDCFDENYAYCERCSEAVHNENSYYVEGYGTVCECCHENNFTSCDGCGESASQGSFSRDSQDNFYCERCAEDMPGLLHHWDYRPGFIFYGKGPLYFGIELEIEFRDSNRYEILEFLGEYDWLYLKSDGSLDNGIEIVTMPTTFDVFCKRKDEIRRILAFLRGEGCRSYNTSTCGVHIHASRKAVTPSEEVKIAHFIADNKEQCQRFAQRPAKNWAKNEKKKLRDYPKSDDRYSAVNFTNPDTIEIRIFRGSLGFDAFWSYLLFCRCLIGFVRTHSIQHLSWPKFCAFVAQDKIYKALKQRLIQKGLFTCASF